MILGAFYLFVCSGDLLVSQNFYSKLLLAGKYNRKAR
jgi:hypothetical protein